MSEFKFTEAERKSLKKLVSGDFLLDRIEQIISARGESDGGVSEEQIQSAAVHCAERDEILAERQQVFVVAGFYHGAKWMRSQIISSPPKPDQQ